MAVKRKEAGTGGVVAKFLLWIILFLGWSGWMFVLGVMADRDMIPDSLRPKYLFSKASGSLVGVVEGEGADQPEEDELFNPQLEFFDDLSRVQEETRIPEGGSEYHYTVQIAALRSRERAQQFMEKLKKQGIAGWVQAMTSENKIWYVIRSGDFKSSDDAKRFRQELQDRLNYNPLVIRLSD